MKNKGIQSSPLEYNYMIQGDNSINASKMIKRVLTINPKENHNPFAKSDKISNEVQNIINNDVQNGRINTSNNLIENGLNTIYIDNIIEPNNNNQLKKIKHNKFFLFFCFLCYSCRKNKQNDFLEKELNFIKKNLDIISIYKKLYSKKKRNNIDIIGYSNKHYLLYI